MQANKNMITVICASITVFFYAQAMEKPALNDISPAVQELIIKAQKTRDITLENSRSSIFKDFMNIHVQHDIHREYYDKLASIALNPNNIMSKQKRLECLVGDPNFEHRKNIIKSMIEKDKINPNEIYWGNDFLSKTCSNRYNPLLDSISCNNDIHFAEYLLAHGARPTKDDLDINNRYSMYQDCQKNDVLKTLFLKYKIMFYQEGFNINNHRHVILPIWEDVPLQDLTESLLNLINVFKKEQTKRFFIIEVFYLKINVIEAIKKVGFTINTSNNDGLIKLMYKKAACGEKEWF